jgi:uroporphyrinogen decarboxylase
VHAINWAATVAGNPDLREGKLRSGKAVMGGISEHSILKNGTPDQVQEEVGKALELTGERHLLLAPGCAVSPQTPGRNVEAIRRALS